MNDKNLARAATVFIDKNHGQSLNHKIHEPKILKLLQKVTPNPGRKFKKIDRLTIERARKAETRRCLNIVKQYISSSDHNSPQSITARQILLDIEAGRGSE